MLALASVVAVPPEPARAEAATDAPVWRTLVDWPRPSVVQDIAQMPSGHLLFAGISGVVRFDGISFKDFPVSKTRSVRRILATQDGAVWVALGAASLGRVGPWPGRLNVGFREGSGGLVRILGKNVQQILPADGQPQNWVWALTETADHKVWIGTEGGLYRASAVMPFSVQAVSLHKDTAGKEPLVTCVKTGPSSDALWVGSSEGLFLVGRNGAKNLWSTPVTALAVHRETAFVAAQDDVVVVRNDASLPRALGLSQYGEPIALAPDGNGGVWSATTTQLIHRRVSGSIETMPFAGQTLPTAMMVDREDSVWLGTAGVGLLQARPTAVRNLWSGHGLEGDVAFSVLRAPDSAMLIRTNAGLLRHGKDGIRLTPYGSAFAAWAPGPMAEFGGTVWVGSTQLFRSDGDAFVSAGPALESTHDVRSILVDRKGDVWTSGRVSGLTRHPAGALQSTGVSMGVEDGLCDGYIAHLAEGPPGIVWGAGNRGLARVEHGRARCLSGVDGFSTNDLTSVVPTSDGRVWVTGVGEIGLFVLHDSKIMAFDEHSGIPSGSFFFAVDDQKGGLWLTSDHGVFFVNRDALLRWSKGGPAVSVRRFTTDDGLRSEHAMAAFPPGAAVATDGTLWVPTLGGLSMVAPPDRQPRAVTAAALDGLTVDGVSFPVDVSPLRIRSDSKNVEFQFAAPSFLGFGRQRFEYRLVGLQSTWSASGEARSAQYAHLAPGDYTFELRLEGVTQHKVSLSFTVVPRFFQTMWFRLLGLVFAALVVFSLYRMRVARISARFELIQSERSRIARELHDGLAQVFLGLGFHLDGLRIALGDEAPAPILKMADGARDLLDRAQAETRRAVWTLRAEFGEDGLRRSLRKVGEDASRALGVSVKVDAGNSAPPASGLLEHELPAIAREAITNAVNHGKARRVKVDLIFDDAGLVLTITDDGKGLASPGVVGSGFGMVGMQERARRVGAELSVAPSAHGGTVVAVFISPTALGKFAK
jgi:signal transduction histidine kinase/ligand-binding sensor domain-containing protein